MKKFLKKWWKHYYWEKTETSSAILWWYIFGALIIGMPLVGIWPLVIWITIGMISCSYRGFKEIKDELNER